MSYENLGRIETTHIHQKHMTTTLARCARYSKHFAIFTAITLGVTQCAQTQDGRLAQGQGTAIGAAGGALLGAAIGGRQGALIGAAIGGASGFAYGSHIANKKAQYKSTEEWLDACIAQAETKRKEAVAYNSRLNNELARLQKEVRMAKASGDTKKLASLKRQIGSERAAAQKQVAAFDKEAEMQRSAIQQAGGAGSSRLKSLRTSTSGIETQVSTMNKNVQRFAALESQTDV
jgi:uncharacterized protein YcfJ